MPVWAKEKEEMTGVFILAEENKNALTYKAMSNSEFTR